MSEIESHPPPEVVVGAERLGHVIDRRGDQAAHTGDREGLHFLGQDIWHQLEDADAEEKARLLDDYRSRVSDAFTAIDDPQVIDAFFDTALRQMADPKGWIDVQTENLGLDANAKQDDRSALRELFASGNVSDEATKEFLRMYKRGMQERRDSVLAQVREKQVEQNIYRHAETAILPLTEEELRNRLAGLHIEVADPLFTDMGNYDGLYTAEIKNIFIGANVTNDRLPIVVTHEMLHTISGTQEAHGGVQKIGVEDAYNSHAPEFSRWMNEALTERAAATIVSDVPSEIYLGEQRILAQLEQLGFDTDLAYRAYYAQGDEAQADIDAYRNHVQQFNFFDRLQRCIDAEVAAAQERGESEQYGMQQVASIMEAQGMEFPVYLAQHYKT